MESSQSPQSQVGQPYQPQYSPPPAGGAPPPKEGMDTATKLVIVIIVVIVVIGSIGGFLLIKIISDGDILGDYNYSEYFESDYDINDNTIIEVNTVNGYINIRAIVGSTLSLEGLKKARFEADLDDVNLDVSYVGNKIIFKVVIDSGFTGKAIDLDLYMPSYVTVDKVASVNGHITVIGMDNVGDVENVNGDITVRIFQMGRNIQLDNVNGDITAYLLLGQDVVIEMTTVNGDMTIDQALSVTITKDTIIDKEGYMGSGGHELSMNTVTGDIDLLRSI